MNEGYLVVATKEELELRAAKNAIEENMTVIITGVGGTNVIRALKDLPKNAYLMNVGYCGSTNFPRGAACEIGMTRLYHPNCEFKEVTFPLMSGGRITCLTSGDFVVGGKLPENSVCDMELAYIAALGFTRLRAVKYVSDGLDYDEYVKESGNEK